MIVGDLTFWENTTMKTRNYTPEIKERAVRMLIEAAGDYPSTWSAIQAIALKVGCTPETLRSWHKKHIDRTIPANIQAQDQAARIKELERENKELKQANEIIRKAAAFFAQAELDRWLRQWLGLSMSININTGSSQFVESYQLPHQPIIVLKT